MSVLLIAHVVSGTGAVVFGAAALLATKGRRLHIASGRGFAVTMLTSSALGALIGALSYATQLITFHAGVLAATLVASGWLAARGAYRLRDPRVLAMAVLNALNIVALVALGVAAVGTEAGTNFGYPAEDYWFLAGMAALAVAGDAIVLVRGTLSEAARIARHLWRVCFGFFIAAGSAFTGPGASAFPASWQASGWLALPEAVIMLAMLFWLLRTLTGRWRAAGGSAA
ncbi:MAG: hypothetical protein AAFX44_00635 [Pseudomonadota bacterium]